MKNFIKTKYKLLLAGLLFVSFLLAFLVLQNNNARTSIEDDNKNNTAISFPEEIISYPVVEVPQEITNFNEAYDYPPVYQPDGTIRIPVLAYHHIAAMPGPADDPSLYVTPEVFEQQMQYLQDKNYKTVSPEEYFEILKAGVNPKQKTIMLTFGDGNRDNYTNAYPILKKYGFTGVFYIISGRLNITPDELREMSQNGMSIQNHSETHTPLTYVTDTAFLQKEIVDSRAVLEAITGKPIISFLYPGCGYNETVLRFVEQAGYSLVFSCGAQIDNSYPGRFGLYRIYVYNDFENFKKRLSGFDEPANY